MIGDNVQHWDDVRLLPWGVDNGERPLILLDVDLLFGPLTPTPNTTLAEAVERIAGTP